MITDTRPHDRFSSTVTLTPASVREFARAVGDRNPLHHDAAHAAQTRYGRPIASGTQTTAHLMALTATHFSQRAAMVGLEFWFRSAGRFSPTRPFRSNGWWWRSRRMRGSAAMW